MEKCLIKNFLASIANVEDVPLVDESIITKSVTEHVLDG